MNRSISVYTLIECIFFGFVSTTLVVYFTEYATAAEHLLPPPSAIGIATDILLYTLLTLPGAFALQRLFPQGRRSQRLLLLLACLTPPSLAFLLAFVSHALWQKTGSMLSVDLLLYGVTHLGNLEKIGASAIINDVLKVLGLLIVFSGLALCIRRIRPRWHRPLLALPLSITLLSVAVQASSKQNSQLAWYKEGHLFSLLAEQVLRPLATDHDALPSVSAALYQAPTIQRINTRPNIIVVILESTRAQSVGPRSGNRPSLTPFFDELATKSLRSRQVYTTTDHTSKALVGILCGMYPHPKFAIVESMPGAMKPRCLAGLLAEQGYTSLFLQTPPAYFEQRATLVSNMGYQNFIAQEQLDQVRYANLGFLSMDDHALVEPAISWMKKQEQPFLLTMLTSGTHYPYIVPSQAPQRLNQPIPSPESAPELTLKAYEASVQYGDKVLHDFFSALQSTNLLKDSIVIVTADHGEAFGEHGAYTHNGIPYAEVMEVPLLIHYPSRYPNGGEILGLRQHMDIVPTVLDALGAEWQGTLPGQSLFNAKGHDLLIGNCWGAERCLSLRQGNEMLTYFYNDRPVQRFDLSTDPAQKSPLPLPQSEQTQAQMRHIVQTTKAIERYWASK